MYVQFVPITSTYKFICNLNHSFLLTFHCKMSRKRWLFQTSWLAICNKKLCAKFSHVEKSATLTYHEEHASDILHFQVCQETTFNHASTTAFSKSYFIAKSVKRRYIEMMSYIKILKEHRFQRLQGRWTGLALRPGELGNYTARKRFTFKPFRDTGICNPSKLDHKTP